MDDAILQRIKRVYSAIGAIEEDDPQKLRATVIHTDKIKSVFQDFRGGLSDEDLSNQAHSVLHNIANLRDHLRDGLRTMGATRLGLMMRWTTVSNYKLSWIFRTTTNTAIHPGMVDIPNDLRSWLRSTV